MVAGPRHDRVGAPCAMDGAVTGGLLRARAEQLLAPEPRAGDVAIPDDLQAHEVTGARGAIEGAGASRLHRPPCGPALDPVERLFAKLEALAREAAARPGAASWRAIGQVLDASSPAGRANYPRDAGHGPAERETL